FKLHIAWVPSHSDVAGNELADIHAKRAAENNVTEHQVAALKRALPRSAAAIRGAYKHAVAAQRTAWWTVSPASSKLQRID
ncbi:hypothetical protein EXIGLDRAFT_598123, partial [Exidia glandulosa HHB12029]